MKRTIIRNIAVISALSAMALCAPAVAGAVQDGGANGAVITLSSAKESYLASVRLQALRKNLPMEDALYDAGGAKEWLKPVNASEVNMVTNRYEKRLQDGIEISGGVYYVSGSRYAWSMRKNPSVRYAKDPLTGTAVDKARAVTYADASGKVYYFESEANFQKFLSLVDEL